MNIRSLSIFFIGLIFWPHCSCELVRIIHHTAEHHQLEGDEVEQGEYVSCRCNGELQTVKVLNKDMKNVFWYMQNRLLCGSDVPERVCQMLKECDDCWAGMMLCKSNQTDGNVCLRKDIKVGSIDFHLDEDELFNNLRNADKVLKRKARQAKVCRFPPGMETADMILTEHPNSIVITLKCIFGYTLEEGIVREMKCNFDQNQWKPQRFEECRPFVDCTLDLVSSGFANCITATTLEAPRCSIACHRYEDKPEVPESAYVCKIDGTWEPHLPYCARPGSGINLAHAPRIKLHSAETKTVNPIGKKRQRPMATHKPLKDRNLNASLG